MRLAGGLPARPADKLGVAFYETSAKDNLMVDAAFLELARDIKDRLYVDFGAVAGNGGAAPAKPATTVDQQP